VWFFRIAAIALPCVVFLATRRICRELAGGQLHPFAGAGSRVVERRADGSYSARERP
jgi:hypothetical protein